jgi:hypothetical protein
MADMMVMNPPPQNQQLPASLNSQVKPPSRERMREIVSRKEAEVTSRIGKRIARGPLDRRSRAVSRPI